MAGSCRVWFPFEHSCPFGPTGGAASAVDGRRGAVLLVADFLHRYVGHEAVGGGSVPVVLAGLEEHPVVWADDLDLSAVELAEADALGDVDGLAVGVGVPSGS